MAWYEKRTDFDDCNGRADLGRGPGVTGGLIIMAIGALVLFGGVFGGMALSDYRDKKSYWECAANPNCKAPNNTTIAQALILHKLLFSNNETAAKEIESHFLTETEKKDMLTGWAMKKLTSEVRLGMNRRFAITYLCSTPNRIGYEVLGNACDNPELIAKLQKGEKIKLFPTGAVVCWSIAGAFYLLAGFVLMGRFIAHFGRPSGGLIAWMAFFAPIFAPFWAVVGLGSATVGLRNVAMLGAKGINTVRAKRQAKKAKENEARIVGDDIVAQREQATTLIKKVGQMSDNATKESLLSKLRVAQRLVEDEAKMRLEVHREAVSRTLRETDGTVNLAQEVDEVLFQAEAHKEAREITRR